MTSTIAPNQTATTDEQPLIDHLLEQLVERSLADLESPEGVEIGKQAVIEEALAELDEAKHLESRHWEVSNCLFFGLLAVLITATLVIMVALVSALVPAFQALYAVVYFLIGAGPLMIGASVLILIAALVWRASPAPRPAHVRQPMASAPARNIAPSVAKPVSARPARTRVKAATAPVPKPGEIAHLVGRGRRTACGIQAPRGAKNAHKHDQKCAGCVAAEASAATYVNDDGAVLPF
jgi:hypothetical protein